MREIAHLEHMNIGSGFRAFALRGGDYETADRPLSGPITLDEHAHLPDSSPRRLLRGVLPVSRFGNGGIQNRIRWAREISSGRAAFTGPPPVAGWCMMRCPP